MSRTASSTDFKVGDKVWVSVPSGRACGTVIEDRGRLGRGGRRLFYVSVPHHPYDSRVFVVDEDEIEHLTEDEQAVLYERLDPDAIKDFLIRGGLTLILVRNSPEPVWLVRGPRGILMHTYIEGYSATGGESPPMFALHGEKISAPKRDAVVRFVKSFGLSDEDAEEVVNKVGVSR
jgi:hypothetical protein